MRTVRQPKQKRARIKMAVIEGDVPGGAGIVRRLAQWRQCARYSRLAAAMVLAAGMGGCNGIGDLGLSSLGLGDIGPGPSSGTDTDTQQVVSHYLGSVAADDPQAVDVGVRILRSGGTAADAAAAMGLVL